MIKEFCLAWEKNKDKLKKYLRTTPQGNYSSYEALVKLIFKIVINPDERIYDQYDTKNIVSIDDGDYQGTLIFILHRDTYQPDLSDYVFTSVDYGSCSGCDTLLSISGYEDGLPSDEQVEDYMTLCLHLLEHCKFMVGKY